MTKRKGTIPQCAAEVEALGIDYTHRRCSRQSVTTRLWTGTGQRFFVCRQHGWASFFWPHESAKE